jgi:hypothetical protein
MADRERAIVPLDDAHELLVAFGISPDSREVQRWRRDDGFRQVDLEDVLNESGSVLGVDWRDCLHDAVEIIVRQLRDLGSAVTMDLDEEDDQGTIRVDGQPARIKFVATDEDDFDDVIGAVNGLIRPKAQYRKFRSSEGSDGWSYAVLKNEDWQALEAAADRTVKLLFSEVGTG